MSHISLRRPLSVVGAVTLCLAALASASPALVVAGTVFSVQTTQDAVRDPSAPPGVCRSDAAGGGLCTLRAAVQTVNGLAGGPHRINLPAGRYRLTLQDRLRLDNVSVDMVGSCCDVSSQPTSIIDGDGRNGVILQTCGTGCTSGTPVVNISGVSFQNSGETAIFNACCETMNLGGPTATDAVTVVGNATGGVDNRGTLSLSNVSIASNGLTGPGRMAGLQNSGTVTGTNVSIVNNTISIGGGFVGAAGIINSAALNLSASDVSNNVARGGTAGGIASMGDGRITLDSVTITGNYIEDACAPPGCPWPAAGLSATGNERASAQLTGVEVSGNELANTRTLDANPPSAGGVTVDLGGAALVSASVVAFNTGDVGGIGAVASTDLNLLQVSVVGNSGRTGAGGIQTHVSAKVRLADSTIDSNRSASGQAGGLAMVGIRGSELVSISGTTISNNTGRGAALINSSSDFTNVTISGNTGTGLYALPNFWSTPAPRMTNATIASNGTQGIEFDAREGGTLQLKSTIVANNTGGNCSRAVPSQGYNLDSANTCGFSGTGDLVNTNPQLGTLADNGGPTQTMALLPGSPAIDAVAASACPPPATDQRGVTRPQGPSCDMGAFEFAPPAAVPAVRSLSKR